MPSYFPPQDKRVKNPIRRNDGTLNKKYDCVGSYLDGMNIYRDIQAYIAQTGVKAWGWLHVTRLGMELSFTIQKGQNEHRDKVLRHVEHALDTMKFQPPMGIKESKFPNETYKLSVGFKEWDFPFDEKTWTHGIE